MTVFFKQKNKNSIGYSVLMNGNQPYPEDLKFDKITFTLQVPDKEQEDIKQLLNDYLITKYAKLIFAKGYEKAYRIMVTEPLNEDATELLNLERVAFTLQLNPWSGTHYLKVSWNPYRIPSGFLQHHLNLLLKNGYSRLMTEGKLTEIDEAVDIHKAKLQDFLFTYPQFTCSGQEFKSGALISLRLGSKIGDKAFYLYNKTQEIKDTNANFFWNKENAGFTKEPTPTYDIMRIEARHDLKGKDITLAKFELLPDYFADLRIYNHLLNIFKWVTPPENATPQEQKVVNNLNIDQMIFRQFVSNCQNIGLQQARLNLTPYYRKKFDAFLIQHQCPWWNPNTKIERTNNIKKLLVPDPLPPESLTKLHDMKGHLFP